MIMFEEKPEGFEPQLHAVGCFVEVDGYILQLLRSSSPGIVEPNKLGSPGGKVEQGERPEDAMVRELQEEISLQILATQLERLCTAYVEWENLKFTYHIFRLVLPYRHVVQLSKEHVAYMWLPPMCALHLPLVQNQADCIKYVYKMHMQGVQAR